MNYCIETSKLSHQFQHQNVLSEVDLKIPVGSIYGFLGPNGAGKTTTLKLLLGLLKKQSGDISVFGLSLSENRVEILKNVGSLIESPSLYGHLTASENLKIWQKIYGVPTQRIDDVLQLVDLATTGNKKAKKFSLGMKQRLSIAIALLNEPKLLILDEPTNGLDPKGILEMRALLKKINENLKVTILISSHLLSEIEKLVSHIGIIHQGKLIFDGTLNELNKKQSMNASILIETNDNDRAKKLLSEHQFDVLADQTNPVLINIDQIRIAQANKVLVNAGIDVYQISSSEDDLESIFMNLTQ